MLSNYIKILCQYNLVFYFYQIKHNVRLSFKSNLFNTMSHLKRHNLVVGLFYY